MRKIIDYVNIALSVLFAQNLLLVFTFAFGAEPKAFLKTRYAITTSVALTVCLLILLPISRMIHFRLATMGQLHFSLLWNAVLATSGTFFLGCLVEKFAPDLWLWLGDSFRSMPTNAAILGVLLLAGERNYSISESVVFALFAGVGVLVALVSLVGIRQNLDMENAPQAFQGMPILFLMAGLLSISLMGFAGLHIPS